VSGFSWCVPLGFLIARKYNGLFRRGSAEGEKNVLQDGELRVTLVQDVLPEVMQRAPRIN